MGITSKLLSLLTLSVISMGAFASIITFDDRTAYENYVNTYTVDTLNTAYGNSYSDLSNSDYSWTMPDYACVNSWGCNGYGVNNPFVSYSNDWVWTYSSGEFNLNLAVTAFGLDYSNPYYTSTAQVGLNGLNSGVNPNGSFFGIATDDGTTFSSINYTQFSYFQAFDNITYSTTSNGSVSVPEPATFGFFLFALLTFGILKQRKS